MPCVLGSNLWAAFRPLGMDISGIEDFLVSQNILPLGSLLYLLFCVSKRGWGWDAFLAEANAGSGLRFPAATRFYVHLCPAADCAVHFRRDIGIPFGRAEPAVSAGRVKRPAFYFS